MCNLDLLPNVENVDVLDLTLADDLQLPLLSFTPLRLKQLELFCTQFGNIAQYRFDLSSLRSLDIIYDRSPRPVMSLRKSRLDWRNLHSCSSTLPTGPRSSTPSHPSDSSCPSDSIKATVSPLPLFLWFTNSWITSPSFYSWR